MVCLQPPVINLAEALGEAPNCFLYTWEKWLTESYPTWKAVSVTE